MRVLAQSERGVCTGVNLNPVKLAFIFIKHQRAPYLHSHVRIAVCLYPYVYIMNEKTALSIRFVGNPNDGFPLGASAFPILCCDVINFRGDFGTPSESNKKKKQEPEPDHNSNSINDSKRLLKIENNSSLINVPSKITTFIQEKNVTQKIHRYLWQE